jgi:uncharacterized membrane protein YfcA
MPLITPALVLMTMSAGAVAGTLGGLLGIGGGMLLVPFLNLALGLPFDAAAAISLTTVIATSSSVSIARAGKQLINLRLGMVLEVATVAGSLFGAINAQLFTQRTLQIVFGVIAAAVGIVMLGRIRQRNVILDSTIDGGLLGGRFHEEESGGDVAYRVRRLPVALLASFLAGNISSLLGVGGGVLKVPALNAWCGVPMRAAAATSAFMIGVTATSGAVVYYGHHVLVPQLAAAAVLGVLGGSWTSMRLGQRVPAKWLKLLMAVVLFTVSLLMLVRHSG